MLIRRRLKFKLILLVIAVILFLYWRGVKSLLVESRGWSCQYHVIYTLCDARNNKAKLPGLWDIFQAGIKF